MGKNVHEQLSIQSPTLVGRIIRNQSLVGMIMGYLNIFHGLRKIEGKPVETMEFGPVLETKDNVFTATIRFNPLASLRPAMWRPGDDLMQYAQSRAAHFAETLRLNPNIGRFIEDLVNTLERWCDVNGVDWRNMEIDGEPPNHAIVTKDLERIRFRVKKKLAVTLV